MIVPATLKLLVTAVDERCLDGLPPITATGTSFRTTHKARFSEALALLSEESFDAVLLDLSVPGPEAGTAVRQIVVANPEVATVVLGPIYDHDIAREVMDAGAQDYLVRFQSDGGGLAHCILRALERKCNADRLADRELLESKEKFPAISLSTQDAIELRRANERLQQEIAERSQIEVALAESEQRYRTFVQNFQGIALQGKLDFGPIFFHGAVEAITGYEEADFASGQPRWNQVIHPDDLPSYRREVSAKLRTIPRFSTEREYRIVRKDGEIRWVHEVIQNVCNEDDKPCLVEGFIHDVTERKRAEEALRKSEAKNRAILDAMPDIMFRLSRDGEYLDFYASNQNDLFMQPGVFLGKRVDEVLTGVAAEKYKFFIRQVIDNGTIGIFEYPLEIPGHGMRIFEARMVVSGQNEVLTIVRNITNRKQAEEELQGYREHLEILVNERTNELTKANVQLQAEIAERRLAEEAQRQSRHQLQLVTDALPALISYVDSKERFRFNNKAYENWYGHAPSELYGKHVKMLLGESDYKEVQQYIKAALSGQEIAVENIIRHQGGESRYLAGIYVPDFDEHGAVKGFFSLMSDVTERVHAEEQVYRAKEYLEKIFDSVTDCIIVTDMNWNIVNCNHATEKIFGYTREEIINKNTEIFYPNKEAFEKGGRTVVNEIKESSHFEGEIVFRRKDDSAFSAYVVASLVIDSDRNPIGVVAIIRDNTKRKRVDDLERMRLMEVAHVSRLSTMGELATEIAHELNQPLTAIASYSDACMRMIKAGTAELDEISEALEEITAQSERAGTIIRRLRSFVGKQESQYLPLDINELVREVLQLVQVEARWHEVDISLDLGESISPVFADKILIEQVILNLVRNGIDAMNDNQNQACRLTIRTTMPSSAFIEVAVQDTGSGLEAETLDQIFEPFYTTKSSGMGMGLNISRSIIEAHSGHLGATSNPEGGSTFRFVLPTDREGESQHGV